MKTEKIRNFLPLAGLLIVFIAFAVLSGGRNLTSSNLQSIFNQSFFIMLAGICATFVYAHGGIDLSIGGLEGICMLIAVVSMRNIGFVPALFLVILTGIVSGILIGGISVYGNIPVFITGLSLQYIYRGILKVATSKALITVPNQYTWLDSWGVKAVVLVAAAAVVGYLFNYTKIGRYEKAIGGNATATTLCGVNAKKYSVLAYVILGIGVGIAGLFAMVRAGGVNPQAGAAYEMDVLIAVVLGGMPLTGGAAARVRCGIIGALLIVVIENGFVLLGADPNLVDGIKGIIFIATVFVTIARRKGQVVN